MRSGVLPSVPSAPRLIEQNRYSILFEWNQPYDNGGTKIDQYELSIVNESTLEELRKIVTNTQLYEFDSSKGLVSGVEYTIKLRARNFFSQYYNKNDEAPWSA
jgi:hypothetical protein